MPCVVLSVSWILINLYNKQVRVGTVIFTLLQKRELRYRELLSGHTLVNGKAGFEP